MRYLIAEAEREGKGSKSYHKALSAICDNYKLESGSQGELDVYAELSQVVRSEAKGESPGYWRALTDPQYRRATFICIVLAITN